jgi:hypothetical protein
MFNSLLKQILGRSDAPELVAEGQILEIQKVSSNGHDGARVEFRLDSQSNLTFQQEESPLSPLHKRGDLVRVHYETSRDNPSIAVVRWIESKQS